MDRSRESNAWLPQDIMVRRQYQTNWRHAPLDPQPSLTAACTQAQHELQWASRLALAGQFLLSVAHDIATPLSVIAGNAELLRQDFREQGISIDILDTIVEQVDRVTELVQQLFTLVQAKPQPLAPLALCKPLTCVLRLLATRFQHEAITPVVDLPEDLPAVWGDSNQLMQMFLNIFINAWHAMPHGGRLTVQARVLDDEKVQLSFRDTGIGMSAADQARAFDLFYSTKAERGNGLGLAICQQLIQDHHGTIRLDSTLGEGTTVTLTLLRADTVELA